MPAEKAAKEEIWRRQIRKAQEGDQEVRTALITEHIGLVYLVRKRFANRGHDMEELFQIGVIGLIKAIDRFDAERELAFSTYAVPMIFGEIQRFLRDDGMIHISRQIKENARKIMIVKEELKKTDNREPTISQLASLTGLSAEDVALALESTYEVESIFGSVKTEKENDGAAITLGDQIAAPGSEEERLVDRLTVRQLLNSLPPKERTLIVLRYVRNKTQNETAKVLGMNQVAVSRMEKKILTELRKKLE